MKMVPIFRIRDMKRTISSYTRILGFELKEPGSSPNDWVVALINDDAAFLLTSLGGNQKIGIATKGYVNSIDNLIYKYRERGLDISIK